MKKALVVSIVLIALAVGMLYASAGQDKGRVPFNRVPKAPPSNGLKLDTTFGKIPLYFIPNEGQVHPEARFYSRTRKYTLWMTPKGLVFDRYLGCGADKRPLYREVSRLNFLKANKKPEMTAVDKTKHVVSYFKGNDPSRWRTGIGTSKAILYRELYKHIDLKVYGIASRIEYDWMVKPGGDPGRIRFNYENVKGTRIDKEGNLVVETEFGRLVHRRPVSYQDINGERVPVAVTFKTIRKNCYGFKVGVYDKAHVLIIDPVVVSYSTFIGGTNCGSSSEDVAIFLGSAYVVGYTCSSNFPVVNAYTIEDSDGWNNHASADITVSKVAPEGDELEYSSFLGGTGSEFGTSVAVDTGGHCYITGYTSSRNWPYTSPSGPDFFLKSEHQGGVYDAIVTKFSPDGTNLEYSTYLGGNDGAGGGGDSDFGYGIAVDGNECVYVCGIAGGEYFPVLNEAQVYSATVNSAGFVTKLDTRAQVGSTLIYSTYVRGTLNGNTTCFDIALVGTNAIVTGTTTSTDFPATVGAYQTTNGGLSDAFVLQLSQDGSTFMYCTYLGGSGYEDAYGIALDGSTPYITGSTDNNNFPTLNAYQSSFGGGDLDAIVASFNPGLGSLRFSTYLGGSGMEEGRSIALATGNEPVITGLTDSTDLPVHNPVQLLHGGGYEDAFVSRFLTDGSGLVVSSYLGGEEHDHGYGIAASGGSVCVVGYSASSDFLLYNAFDRTTIASGSGFITMFEDLSGGAESIVVTSPIGGEIWASGTTRTIRWGASSTLGNMMIEYSTDNGTTWNLITPSTPNDGSYDWDVPSSPSPECLVRIREAVDLIPTGVSQTTFTIYEGLVLTAPNGGENWEVSTSHPITWISAGSISAVRLELSTDNGVTWSYIHDSTPNDGSFLWTVPDSVGTNNLVRISDATDGDPSDVSNATFNIIALGTNSLTVTYPNGGETFTPGEVETITWTSTGSDVSNVRLEYTTNNGSTWYTIIDSTANDGSYNWTVPAIPSTTCRVRVSDATDGDPSSQSNEVFTIDDDPRPPEITLTAPNFGTFSVLSRVNITWTSVGDIPSIHIEFSSDGGTTWTDIETELPNSGSYLWRVPNSPSTRCLIRISDAADGDPSDVSNNYFTILTPDPFVSLTSPVGGEVWKVGTTHDIEWASFQSVGDLKIEFSTDNKGTWTTIEDSTDNDGSYPWTVPNMPSTQCFVRISEVGDGIPTSTSPRAFTITTGEVEPRLSVNRTSLYFGSLRLSKVQTPSQKLFVSNAGIGTLKWRATYEESWLGIDAWSGTQNGIISVSVDPLGMEAGTYTGTITICDSQDDSDSVDVTVTYVVYPAESDSAPVGGFDSPVQGSTVRSSVPVTGWAVDDIAVERVSIWREGTQAEGGGKQYVGDAMLVEGARPDVEPLYPTYPMNYKAGWGYMMLTYFLPNGGNGSYTLYAYAHDGAGHETLLGTKTITCDNANAVKPFGAIDTPGQGSEVFGEKYRNNGWVLTPMPNRIPTDGSTITVYIDGVAVGNPAYGYAREDVAELFPNYANTDGPHGYFYFDTTAYENGVHTISWVATDNAGNSDGIGSRYFVAVTNTGYGNATGKVSGTVSTTHKSYGLLSQLAKVPVAEAKSVDLVTGYGEGVKPGRVVPGKAGRVRVKMKEDGRIELRLGELSKGYRYMGYLVVGKELRPLPAGSSMDSKKGIFYWQAGASFLGKYELLFIGTDVNGKMVKWPVSVTIEPKFSKKQ